MSIVFVAPAPVAEGAPARLVRHPERGFQPLPAAGDWWPDDLYTAARLRDGDVVRAEPPAEPAEPDEASPKAAARRAGPRS